MAAVLDLIAAGATNRRELRERFGYTRDKLNRRLREGRFTAFEAAQLAAWYDLRVSAADEIAAGAESATFTWAGAQGVDFSARKYFATVATGMEGLRAAAGSDTRVSIRYSSSDVNFFALVAHPLLARYKAYYYTSEARAVRGPFLLDSDGGLDGDDSVSGVIVADARRAADVYDAADTIEVWGRTPFASLFSQWERLARQRCFDADVSEALFAALERVVDEVAEALHSGRKRGGGTLTLFENGAHGISPTAVTEAGPLRTVSVVTANPNYVRSSDPAAYEHFAEEFERRRARSSFIGGPGMPLDRAWVARMRDDISATRAHVSGIIAAAG